jgi:hypothetical protein
LPRIELSLQFYNIDDFRKAFQSINTSSKIGESAHILKIKEEIRRGAFDSSFIVWLVINIALPIGTSVVASYLYDKTKNKKSNIIVNGKIIHEPTLDEIRKILDEHVK